jgi:hypothetical protein
MGIYPQKIELSEEWKRTSTSNQQPTNTMPTVIPTEERLYRKQIRLFKKNLRNQLLTSRFTTATWTENEFYRKKHRNVGCIYCSPDPISKSILVDTNLFILEMNNDTNKIIGIGLIRNQPVNGKLTVYSKGNYNRYTFVGRTRIDRSEMNEEEDLVMKIFDILCFRGNKHMKRGQGLKSFPTELLFTLIKQVDLIKYIGNMFKDRLENSTKEANK